MLAIQLLFSFFIFSIFSCCSFHSYSKTFLLLHFLIKVLLLHLQKLSLFLFNHVLHKFSMGKSLLLLTNRNIIIEKRWYIVIIIRIFFLLLILTFRFWQAIIRVFGLFFNQIFYSHSPQFFLIFFIREDYFLNSRSLLRLAWLLLHLPLCHLFCRCLLR